MAEKWFYLSTLKGRQAEYGALAELDPETSRRVTPLIQLWPGNTEDDGSVLQQFWPDEGEDAVSGSLIKQLLEKVKDTWSPDRPVLLDGEWLAGAAAFKGVLAASRAFGRKPLPVTGLGRSDAYQNVIAESIALDHLGCVLRLVRDDFRDDFAQRLEAFLSRLGLPPSEIDVVLDLGHLERQYLERDEIFAASMIRSLPHLQDWRNLVLVASAAPASARGFQPNGIEPYPRLEWWLWQLLQERADSLDRLPTFGDYGVIHPDRVEESANPRALPRVPQIRYTGESECLVVRGLDLNKHDADHVPPLFRQLMKRDEWCGHKYSAAERWIADVAQGNQKVGNGMVWKRVGTVHHWTFVIQQLANRSAP